VADIPQKRLVPVLMRGQVTVMPVAVVPTTPVQTFAPDWFAPPGIWDPWRVQVTEPPDADGVTLELVPDCSLEAITTMMSPATTLKLVVVFDVPLDEKLPVLGTL
jgi:hypothetical protein